jgi:glycine betaine/proline transport system ATP-binding protein
MTIIDISHLDVIFGKNKSAALALLDQGKGRQEVKEKTGRVIGVHDVSLSINKGEIFVIMGLSGSGKSTLLRTINGLTPITRGQVSVFVETDQQLEHFSLTDADETTIRHLRMHHISMVFQKFSLLPWKTVAENVAFGLEISGASKSAIETKIKESLSLVGLTNWAKQYPSELSGGMQQRVGLARALATNASILLMDEPFSALDPLIRTHLQQELLHMQKNLNKTILFVTHDLDEALKLGNRIAIMQEGKIVQVGTAEEIVSHPKTQYVKDFVSHIDQTRLLRVKAIMTSITQLQVNATDSSVALDQNGLFRCLLDESGRPRRSLCGDVEGRIVPWTLFQSGSFNKNDLILGNEHLMIKDVIDAVGRTKKPMVIQDKAGKMIGAVTTDSILHALSMK